MRVCRACTGSTSMTWARPAASSAPLGGRRQRWGACNARNARPACMRWPRARSIALHALQGALGTWAQRVLSAAALALSANFLRRARAAARNATSANSVHAQGFRTAQRALPESTVRGMESTALIASLGASARLAARPCASCARPGTTARVGPKATCAMVSARRGASASLASTLANVVEWGASSPAWGRVPVRNGPSPLVTPAPVVPPPLAVLTRPLTAPPRSLAIAAVRRGSTMWRCRMFQRLGA